MTTERDLLDALWARLNRRSPGFPPRYVMAEQVRYTPAHGGRIADALAIDTWGSGHYAIEGYEAKVSRSDWRRELADPSKADAWRQHCARWYVLAPAGLIRPDELPTGWGLIEHHPGGHTPHRLRCRVRSHLARTPLPLQPATQAALMRATSQTAQQYTRRALAAREAALTAAQEHP